MCVGGGGRMIMRESKGGRDQEGRNYNDAMHTPITNLQGKISEQKTAEDPLPPLSAVH